MVRFFTILNVMALSFFASACSSSSTGCDTDSDCPSGRYCVAEHCIFDCIYDSQCPDSYHCSIHGRCEGGCIPTNNGVEACDGLDNDCDELTDENWDQLGQPCSNQGCTEGEWICSVDHSGVVCDGPVPLADDSSCNGIDDDCDGDTDEDVVDIPCPLQLGVCEGAVRKCLGESGWSQCDYRQDYSEGQDDTCDQKDNDCDGVTDEDASNLLIQEFGEMATDGLDNNCNGLVDERGGVMVPHPTVKKYWIDAYETLVSASPDCTGPFYGQTGDDYPPAWGPGPDDGSITLYACSLPNVIPSAYLSWYRLRSACRAQGKDICSASQWSIACNHGNSTLYPYGIAFGEGICNDAWHSLSTGVQRVAPTGSYNECTAAGQMFDASGNLAEWVNAWHDDYPEFALFIGYGFKCELCQFGENCRACLDSQDDYEIIEEELRCTLNQNGSFVADYPDAVREYLGGRCCYSK